MSVARYLLGAVPSLKLDVAPAHVLVFRASVEDAASAVKARRPAAARVPVLAAGAEVARRTLARVLGVGPSTRHARSAVLARTRRADVATFAQTTERGARAETPEPRRRYVHAGSAPVTRGAGAGVGEVAERPVVTAAGDAPAREASVGARQTPAAVTTRIARAGTVMLAAEARITRRTDARVPAVGETVVAVQLAPSRSARIRGAGVVVLAEFAVVFRRTATRVVRLRSVQAFGSVDALVGTGARVGELAVVPVVPGGAPTDVGRRRCVDARSGVGTRRSETRVHHFAEAAPEPVGAVAPEVVR